MNGHDDIRLGTLIPAHDRTAEIVRQLLPHGFESFQIAFGTRVGDFPLPTLAESVRDVFVAHPAAQPSADLPPVVSALGWAAGWATKTSRTLSASVGSGKSPTRVPKAI